MTLDPVSTWNIISVYNVSLMPNLYRNTIYTTGVFSLIVQIFTGLIGFYVLFWVSVPASLDIIRQLLWMECVVQIVEFVFYVWMVSQFQTIENITPFRYWDWAITTPTMLTSFMIYLYYLSREQDSAVEDVNSILWKHYGVVVPVLLLNWLMLFFGYLGELRFLSMNLATGLGFIPFFTFFYWIWKYFAQQSTLGMIVFGYFLIVWGLYGVASLLNYKAKNICYNILDLFSKNFFGLYFAWLLLK